MLDQKTENLCRAFAKLDKSAHVMNFLEDLCTPAELTSMADRLLAASLVDQGVSYRDIYEKTGVSTATVTRVARSLGSKAGGYRRVLNKIKKKVDK